MAKEDSFQLVAVGCEEHYCQRLGGDYHVEDVLFLGRTCVVIKVAIFKETCFDLDETLS